jgi:restriction system protein
MKQKTFFAFGLLLYIGALFLPVWKSSSAHNQIDGFYVLILGWLGLVFFEPRWFCNLVVVYAALSIFGKGKESYARYSFVLALVSLTTIFGPYHTMGEAGAFGGGEGKAFAAGGYVWIAALWVFYFAAFRMKKEKQG